MDEVKALNLSIRQYESFGWKIKFLRKSGKARQILDRKYIKRNFYNYAKAFKHLLLLEVVNRSSAVDFIKVN